MGTEYSVDAWIVAVIGNGSLAVEAGNTALGISEGLELRSHKVDF